MQIIISYTILYTFEMKRENDRKGKVWRQTVYASILMFIIALEAQYERLWIGPMLFSLDCSTLY